MPYEVGADDESMMNLEASPVAVVSPKVVPPSVLGPDEERRTRRRGSQLWVLYYLFNNASLHKLSGFPGIIL